MPARTVKKATRKSPRNSPTEIFKNIYGVEGTKDTPPVIVEFHRNLATERINFNHEMERGDLKYAPSDKNPYYMCVYFTQLADLLNLSLGGCQWATPAQYTRTKLRFPRAEPYVASDSYFNISLKLFYDMANDQVDWMALSNLEDPQVVNTPEEIKKEAIVLKEMAFAALSDLPQRDPLDGKRYDEADPVMQIEADATARPPQLVYQNPPSTSSIDYERERWEISDEAAQNEPRRAYIPMRHPQGWLIWIRLPNWSRDRQQRRGQLMKLKKEFEKLWMYSTATDPETAAGYRPRYSSVNLGFPLYVVPQHDSLKLHLGWQADQIVASFENLVGEINNGRSQPNILIPVTDEDVRNRGFLKMGENPFLLFTTYISADNFNSYMQSLEAIKGKDQNLDRRHANRVQRRTDPELRSWLLGNYKPMDTLKYTEPQKTARRAIDSLMQTEDPLYLKDRHSSAWRIGVSWDKVDNASGKRIGVYAPKEIMGMSANVAAEKAFGWEVLDRAKEFLGHDHRMSSGMFMAEWLHLCAFSWGGLTTNPESTKLVYRSSDIPENLIIGTSETNSVMTRFEKAWQALVRDETDLWIGGNDAFHAKLVVARNLNDENVVWDTKAAYTNRYGRKEDPMTQTERAIAKSFHFVAYTVSYSIEFPTGCKLLAMEPGSRLRTTFYPFLRPLYHRLEDQLDQALYEKIKARRADDLVSEGLKAMSLGVNPTTTDGQIPYDGTVQYGDVADLGTSAYATSASTRRKVIRKNAYNRNGETKKNAGVSPHGKMVKGYYAPL